MKRVNFAAWFVTLFCMIVAFTQFLSAQTGDAQPQNGSPVAYVYVSSQPSQGNYEINAFAADSSGRLTAVSGSPFSADVLNMAVNGKYLFGTNGVDIFSFSIAPDGGLQQVSSINAQQYNGGNSGGPYALFLDHTGATLYDEDIYGNNGANNDFQFFTINEASGALTYLGVTSVASTEFWTPLSFTGNNLYAFGSYCYHWGEDLYGFQRNNDGSLSYLNNNPPMPTPQSGDFYCPFLAEGDPANHLAVSVWEICCGYGGQPVGAPQLATYTVDGSGNLTTQSTHANMPHTMVKYVTDLSMSPSGKLLAVAGGKGVQVFHFNGANPVTRYTGLLMKDPVGYIDQMFWDNANHLYVISNSASKLYVFTITPTSYHQAAGSPYSITSPVNIIVLPKT